MIGLLARRSLRVIPLLGLVSILAFGLLRIVPGDPAVQLAGEFATDDQIEAIRDDLGLDRPLVTQYVEWLGGVLRGDFGDSLFSSVPVATQIGQRAPATVSLLIWALALSTLLGIPAGLVAGRRPGSFVDRVLTVGTTVGLAVPVFVTALLLSLVVGLRLDWLPATGYVPISEDVVGWARHLALPAAALALTGAAEIARQTRAGVIEVQQLDHIRTARAAGLSAQRVLVRHTLKNAMIPVITVIGLQTSRLFALSVIVERIFDIPGLGSRLVTAVFENDVPFIQATVLLVGAVIVVVNVLVDVSYGWFSPPIRDAS